MSTTKSGKLELTDTERAEVVARLKESKAEHQLEEYDAGRNAGLRWARDEASERCLRVLTEIQSNSGSDWPQMIEGGMDCSLPEEFRDAVDAAQESDVVMGLGAGSYLKSDEFTRGFAEGAIAVWEEVQGEI